VRAKVESALAVRVADCGYDEWLHIGMAIHAELGAPASRCGITGRRASKYPGAKELAQQWKSFKPAAASPARRCTASRSARLARWRLDAGAFAEIGREEFGERGRRRLRRSRRPDDDDGGPPMVMTKACR
jgi:hypothetical protein